MGCPKVTRASRPWGLLGAQTVGQGLIVEAHHIGTDHCGGDVCPGQLGHAVLVGVAVVLGPVTLDVELEALAAAAITDPGEGDAGLPLVIPTSVMGVVPQPLVVPRMFRLARFLA